MRRSITWKATSAAAAAAALTLGTGSGPALGLGHAAGDTLLGVTGRRLQDADLGMVARLGGDEFAVLLRDVDDAHALATAASLRSVVIEPVPIVDAQLVATASVGVAGVQGRARSADEVLGEADVAMHSAKAARSGVEAYRPEDGHRTARRLRLAHDLPTALAEGALELWFQPQARCLDGEVTGFGTLLRWNHPDLGMVPPPEIVAVAQRTGQIRTLTDSIVARALQARAEWARAGHDLDVAVNVTAGEVADPTLVERIDAALTVTATPPGALVLEVTESDALGDPQQAVTVLEDLAARGSASRSTTSAPGTRAWPISTVFRSTRSRSTSRSCSASRRRSRTPRSSAPPWRWLTTSV